MKIYRVFFKWKWKSFLIKCSPELVSMLGIWHCIMHTCDCNTGWSFDSASSDSSNSTGCPIVHVNEICITYYIFSIILQHFILLSVSYTNICNNTEYLYWGTNINNVENKQRVQHCVWHSCAPFSYIYMLQYIYTVLFGSCSSCDHICYKWIRLTISVTSCTLLLMNSNGNKGIKEEQKK